MNKLRKDIILSNQISRMKTYLLGSYEQRVLLDGKDATNPVMLVLHGGPGTPIPFSAGCRGLFPEFTDRFIMVYWDQLGCGINNHPIDDNFSIDMYVDMAEDLIKELKKEFPDNQLILLGTSWGSVLAAKVVARVPELVDNVLAYGQILNKLFFNEEVYSILGQSKLPQKVKKRLIELQGKLSRSPEELKEMATWIRKYTEGYQAKSNEKTPIGFIIRGLLTSPDYTFKDFVAIIKNGSMINTSLWKELMQIDLSEVLQNIQVPYRILQGSTDIVTSSKAVSKFVSESQNSNLSFRMIDNNGHIPNASGINEVLEECIKLIK